MASSKPSNAAQTGYAGASLEYSERLTIVVTAALQGAANAAAMIADPTTDDQTFSVGLVPASSTVPNPTPTHYWCGWQMTSDQKSRLTSELGKRAGSPIQVIPAGATVSPVGLVWFFAETWEADDVLAALSLQRMPPPT